ncbi:MAG: helix-turn-helix transcriptional regulator [Planctomycetia bacterium]
MPTIEATSTVKRIVEYASPSGILDVEMLGVHINRAYRTVSEWDAAGKLPAHRRDPAGRKYWVRSEIDAWIEAGMPSRKDWEKLRAAAAAKADEAKPAAAKRKAK